MAATKVTYKNGDKFRVVTQQGNYVVGEVYTVNQMQSGNQLCGTNKAGTNMGQWIIDSNVTRYTNTKEELLELKESYMAKLDEVNAKLKYLAESGADSLDEKEFKVYQALTILDTTKNRQEQVRKITALIGNYI